MNERGLFLEGKEMNVEDIVAAYDRAWNEPDPVERRRLLELSWAEDGELVDPTGRFQDREAIIERLAGFSERFPGARIDITSGIDDHHGFVRYAWTITDADGARLLEGIDVCELAEDGRLRRVVMFFGPLPGMS
jgi:hypothetical protein